MSASPSEREDSAVRCPIHGGPPSRSDGPQGWAQDVPDEPEAGAEGHFAAGEARRVGPRMCPMSPRQEPRATLPQAKPAGLGTGRAQ